MKPFIILLILIFAGHGALADQPIEAEKTTDDGATIKVVQVAAEMKMGLGIEPTELPLDGRSIRALVSSPQEVNSDVYLFKVTEEATVYLLLNGLQDDLDLSVYQENFAVVESSANGGSSDEGLALRLRPGIYVARVQGFENQSTYALHILGEKAPVFKPSISKDPGSSFTSATHLGTLQVGQKLEASQDITEADIDTYKFDLPEGAKWPTNIRVTLSEVNPSNTDLMINLGHGDLGLLGESDEAAGVDEVINAQVGSGKDFVVQIKGYTESEMGNYKLTVELVE